MYRTTQKTRQEIIKEAWKFIEKTDKDIILYWHFESIKYEEYFQDEKKRKQVKF
jgi:hypothetical protein